jgi:hypothetical protein
MALHKRAEEIPEADRLEINPIYVQVAAHELPKYRIPRDGMLPDTALQSVKDELIGA